MPRPRRPSQPSDWLSRALARAGVLPPGEAEAAIRAGRVQLNRRTVRQPLAEVRAGDEARLDGRPVPLSAETLVLAFHKPKGVVTAPTDPQGKGTVFERLQAALPKDLRGYGWHAVGRLDRDTTGLLLFTNDERVVAHVTSPKTHLPKRYLATVQGRADEAKLEPLRRGVPLPDGPARPARARVLPDGRVELEITEGRFHQVKHMLAAVKLPVTALHREAVGGVVLDVPEGAFRRLGREEIAAGLGYSAPFPEDR